MPSDLRWTPDGSGGGTLSDLGSRNHIRIPAGALPWLFTSILVVSADVPPNGPTGYVQNAVDEFTEGRTDCHVYASCCTRAGNAEAMMFKLADRLVICAGILGRLAEKKSPHTEIYETS